MSDLEKLLYLTGVAADYLDYSGRHCTVAREDRLRVLRACGYDPDDSDALAAAVFALDARPWQHWLRPLAIADEPSPQVSLQVHPSGLWTTLSWRLDTEGGAVVAGDVVPAACPETGNYLIDGVRYSARQLSLAGVAAGYHRLTVSDGSREEQAEVVVCPSHCHDVADRGRKLWGISCQLYTLRSARNWGVGDFADLLELVELAAAQGADLVGLNPLHAPCSDSPDVASPYSPSDRRFLNPLYIAPELVAEYAATGGPLGLLGDPLAVAELEALRSAPLVDYDRVSRLKYRVYEALFQAFAASHLGRDSDRGRAFQGFVAVRGEALAQFAAYEVRHNPHPRRYRAEPAFYQYLQWQAAEQLALCQRRTGELGMAVGLMGDLAVGSVLQGCEVWSNPDLYLPGVTIGAPPDPFAADGQNWGLPVMPPLAMADNRFHHFRALLRANMAAVGALRIDHAMALLRLWWCLPEAPGLPAAGVYVYYPMRELMALVRLESQRNGCLVVGEDLGVVPPEFRQAMAEGGIYGNKLLYFEQHPDHSYKHPQEHGEDALLLVTNHDVATLAAWWNRHDLALRRQLGLVADADAFAVELSRRERDKGQLLSCLDDGGLLTDGWRVEALDRPFDFPLCAAIHRWCARGRSRLLLVQLEDLQLLEDPVNIPGTYREYPNWRRKQRLATAAIFADPQARHILDSVNRERQREKQP